MLTGRRVHPDLSGRFTALQPGDYAKNERGHWYGKTPNGHMCNLAGHTITENANGTITAAPSIRVFTIRRDGTNIELWHGYLDNGNWREC